MTNIEVEWERFDNFFDLWERHKKSTQLLYVIGEKKNCYIGCIGIDDGLGGLGQRYQKQYVKLSRAIFNMSPDAGQVAYAGVFNKPEIITGAIIGASEALVQQSFMGSVDHTEALFEPTIIKPEYSISHKGNKLPAFFTKY